MARPSGGDRGVGDEMMANATIIGCALFITLSPLVLGAIVLVVMACA